MPPPSHRHAAPLLLLGCVIFGLGSLIVKFVAVGSYAIAFWRLAIAGIVFCFLAPRLCQIQPHNHPTLAFYLLSRFAPCIELALSPERLYSAHHVLSNLLLPCAP